jgi:hypothetical protein
MYFSTRSTPPVAGEISLLFSVLFFCFPDAQEVTSLVQECYYKKLICFQKKKGTILLPSSSSRTAQED